MTNTTIFMLTHNKEVKFDTPDDGYKPMICGNAIVQGMNNYVKDNEGKGISTLYPFYGIMTGQYWAWKNATTENIGFCQYDQIFLKNHLMKLKSSQAASILNDYDIILPEKTQLQNPFFDLTIAKEKTNSIHYTHYPVPREWSKMRYVIEEIYPDYLYAYDLIFEDKSYYQNNMFITNREIFDDYMLFAFRIMERMRLSVDPQDYLSRTYPLGIHFAEVLLNTYLRKNQLKVKELPILEAGEGLSLTTSLNKKIPSLRRINGSDRL